MAPWLKGYTTGLSELSTELTVEKMEGQEPFKVLNTYSEMFFVDQVEERRIKPSTGGILLRLAFMYKDMMFGPTTREVVTKQLVKGRKILIKGKPGVGKSSLSKKIAWDWATGRLDFSLVFFLPLKLVRLGQSIEDIILEQYSVLETLNISKQKIIHVINKLGEKVLLIMDGLDEQDLGSIEDVDLTIKGKNLKDCCLLVTSTPHRSRNVEVHFKNILVLNGFTEKHSEKFVEKFLKDSSKTKAVVKFSFAAFAADNSMYVSPMLLQFICILVNDDVLDFSRRIVAECEIYWRLVRCILQEILYRKG